MWWRKFKDYPPDQPLKKERVEPGKGIVGCEMDEFFGWGHSYDQTFPKKEKQGLFNKFFGKR